MIINVKVPTIGESISEAEIARWLVEEGQFVEKGEDLVEIDSEKATITVSADTSGKIKIISDNGATVKIGGVIAEIETDAQHNEILKDTKALDTIEQKNTLGKENIKQEHKKEEKSTSETNFLMTPLAREIIKNENIKTSDIQKYNSNGKITKQDVLRFLQKQSLRKDRTVKMSMLRRKLSDRLVAVKNQTAMLTTFNEVDMSSIISLRLQYKDDFQRKHDVKLGFMSFFVKAVSKALKEFPNVNASIDGENIVYHDFVDVSIAVSTDKGLMVPVLRNTELLSLAAIEKQIQLLSDKARSNKISIEEMTGGTFTITNGGIFGSMLSTPIINPPQSAILGMHNIQERAVVVKGEIAIRPIMYIALSYDHRIIDGKESVGFLVRVKELLENPLLLTNNPNLNDKQLLEI